MQPVSYSLCTLAFTFIPLYITLAAQEELAVYGRRIVRGSISSIKVNSASD